MKAATALVALCVSGLLSGADSKPKSMPPEFKHCNRDDPNFQQCMLEAAKDFIPRTAKSYPTLKLYSLDPYMVPEAYVDQGSGQVQIKFGFINSTVKGMSTAQVKYAKYDLDKNKYYFNAFIPTLTVSGLYDMNGRFLLLPVNGNGKYNITLLDAAMTLNVETTPVTKDGVAYRELKSLSADLVPSKAIFAFDNLFGGDKRLGEAMNKVMNDNWKLVIGELLPVQNQVLNAVLNDYAKKIFNHVPFDELFPNKS